MSAYNANTIATSDVEYDLIATLSNLLQGEEILDKYADDADKAGDQQASKLFRDLHERNKLAARNFRIALASHLEPKA